MSLGREIAEEIYQGMDQQQEEILKLLLGETRIDVDGGSYLLSIKTDIFRTAVDDYEMVIVAVYHGDKCVFYKDYFMYDASLEWPFSFAMLSRDLAEEGLGVINEWLVNFARSKGWEQNTES